MPTEDCCKVNRILREYRPFNSAGPAAADQNNELAARWLGQEDKPEKSVRALTAKINDQILESSYEKEGRRVPRRDIPVERELLRGDDCEERHELILELKQEGIDPDDICGEMIGKSTLNRHLNKHLNIDKSIEKERETKSWVSDKIEYARKVSRENVKDGLQALDQADELPGGERASVSVALYVECPECGTTSRMNRVLSREGVCPHCNFSRGKDSAKPTR